VANLLETLRNSIIDSIKGRKIGIDSAGYMVGIPGVKVQIETRPPPRARSPLSDTRA
jgi:hypothetical protein